LSSSEEIVPGVWGVNLGFVNAFVLRDDVVTLIDTGVRKQAGKLSAALDEIGGELSNIALTHHHPDHRGGLGSLRKEGMTVWVHEIDAPVVTGEKPEPGPAIGGFGKLAILALRPVLSALVMGKPESVAVDRAIDEGAEIPGTGGLRAIHTPGHTMGHVSFIHPDKRFLFVGDAAHNRSGLGLPVPTFTEDMDLAKRTLSKIAELDFDVAVFGHGTVLRGKANTEFRKLADSVASA
jgi:glyoxylase-like metal-dependent hydrolase (beta-lactamase superfamily II)